jgi:hypothetical protein
MPTEALVAELLNFLALSFALELGISLFPLSLFRGFTYAKSRLIAAKSSSGRHGIIFPDLKIL